MKHFGMGLSGAALLLLVGCSGNPSQLDAIGPQEREVIVRIVDGPVDRTADANGADGQEIICKRERMVGSRFSRMICKTRQEIERERLRGQQFMKRIHEQNAAAFMRR